MRGKVPAIGSGVPTAVDHPRLCGEKLTPLKIYGINWGSPPPMRGKENVNDVSVASGGITPAYAGKSHIFTMRLHSG